jgi:hypothetical protein
MINNWNSVCSLTRIPFTLRSLRLQRAVWIGILLMALFSSSTSQLDTISVSPRSVSEYKFLFDYQSQYIGFGDWISLFTLCLAPIIVHLVAGVPKPGKLTENLFLVSQPDLHSHSLPPPAALDRSYLSLQPDLDPLALLHRL